jgi:hypothetical protein
MVRRPPGFQVEVIDHQELEPEYDEAGKITEFGDLCALRPGPCTTGL